MRQVIAEIGQNHMGDMFLAKKLIDEAKKCGADFAKFQLYDSEKLYGKKQEQELSFIQASELFQHGKEVGIEVFFSVFDIERVKWCHDIGVNYYKVAAKSIDDFDIVYLLSKTHKPIIMSLPWGIPSQFILDAKDAAILRFLYVVPEYPARPSQYKINEIDFTDFAGISDHTKGISLAKKAFDLGAQIVEKHFRLKDNPISPDYPHSIPPKLMKELCDYRYNTTDSPGR